VSDFLETVNEDFVVQYQPQSLAIPNQNPSEKIETKSTKVLCANLFKNTLVNLLTLLQIQNCTLIGYSPIQGTATIQSTCQKCLHENQSPLRRTDNDTCRGTFVKNDNTHAVYNCQCSVNIFDAGQNKVLEK
jgi:hypothetical protein